MIAGLLLSRVLPGALPHSILSNVAGVTLLAVGLAFILFAAGLFRQRGTNISPTQPATTLVMDGPYRFTRNPMYVGLALIYTGVALLFASAWAMVLLLPVLILVRYFVIAKEEQYLLGKFGDEYARFTGRVRRWI